MTKAAGSRRTESPDIQMKFRILRAVDQPIDELSVKDICANAHISRDTFYRHFASKYDIAVWHGEYVQGFNLDNVGRTIDWQTGYYLDFSLLAAEERFYTRALRNLGRNVGEFPLMNDHRKNVIVETLQDWRKIPLNDSLMFCLDAFVTMETMLVSRWLRDGCNPEPSVFAKRMMDVVPHPLVSAMSLD
jgi:AcrR family transcriptional regulator